MAFPLDWEPPQDALWQKLFVSHESLSRQNIREDGVWGIFFQ